MVAYDADVQRLMGIGWFPAEEWPLALERWPELGQEMPHDHAAYRAAIEAKVRTFSAHSPGATFVLAPLRVAELDQRAAEEGMDAGSGEMRGRLSAELTQRGLGVPWPPARNAACWCGSAQKYKRCCAALPAPPDRSEPTPEAGDQV